MMLPEPSLSEQQLSAELVDLICAQIDRAGPISFADFMQQALYYPGLGYYSNDFTSLGRSGDFVTAPEISPLFAQCIARYCQGVWSSCSAPHAVLELGAGSGQLAVDLLLSAAHQGVPIENYYILELSAHLQQRQRETIARLAPQSLDHVAWLSALPAEFSGVILANEVMDAMPVHVVVQQQKQWYEHFVVHQQGKLAWQLGESRLPDLSKRMRACAGGQGYQTEVNVLLEGWLRALADCLQQGSVLLIDYGFVAQEYYHPDRSMGTLMCHYRHQAHADPLWYPGIQDVTAHVDFTAVAKTAQAAGLSLAGFTHQAGFLLNCGLLDFLSPTDRGLGWMQQQVVHQLTSPSEMGELFKVMAFVKGGASAPVGLADFSQVARLQTPPVGSR